MKALLINPPRFKGLPVIREERCEIIEGSSLLPPYSLLQVGALIEKKVDAIKLIDANGFDLNFDQLTKEIEQTEYDILIFKFTPTSFKEDIKIAEISKRIKPNAITIGICYSLGPIAKQVMEEAKALDIYIRHEYEEVTPNVIERINDLSKVDGIAYRDNGNIVITKNSKGVENYDGLPIAAFHLLPSLKPYYIAVNHGKPFTIIYASKGCPYNCMYCNVAQSRLKIKSVDRLMKEIVYLKQTYSIKTISFFDETFTLDKERVKGICEGIKPLKIRWYCNTRTNLVTPEILKMMHDAGCRAISFGIESASPTILENVSKRATVENHSNALRWAADAGIKTHCSFIFGLPGETKETIQETITFIKKTLPNSIEINIATPSPGTRLYDHLVKKGLLPNDINWHFLYQDIAQYNDSKLPREYIETIRRKTYSSLYFNPRWILKNTMYVLRNPDDFELAFRYVLKTTKDIFINRFNIVRKKE